jgi:hypothetical protein
MIFVSSIDRENSAGVAAMPEKKAIDPEKNRRIYKIKASKYIPITSFLYYNEFYDSIPDYCSNCSYLSLLSDTGQKGKVGELDTIFCQGERGRFYHQGIGTTKAACYKL